jgi:UDP-N-acetylmuramoyl-tripeptide--D-alanyl-D-alanine ligase
MTEPLWTKDAFATATGGTLLGDVADAITGISIDSRTLQPGDAFVAIKGDRFDGHDFVAAALEAGASVALVAESRKADLPENGRYILVADPLEALRRLGTAARARTDARIVAVTGSVGIGKGSCLGRLLQQSLGRAADAGAHAGRHRVSASSKSA